MRVTETLEVRDSQREDPIGAVKGLVGSTVSVLGPHVTAEEKCHTCEETKGHLTTSTDAVRGTL